MTWTEVKQHLINIRGKQFSKRLVVFESDDWGSVRMKDRSTFEKLVRKYPEIQKDPYNRYDTLATTSDLLALYETLNTVKSGSGTPAVITANAVMANPDFEAIKESGFQKYIYEPFTETLKRYKGREKAFSLWKEGINNKLFIPQFHGREHINVFQWMLGLQRQEEMLYAAFSNDLLCITRAAGLNTFGYMKALDYLSDAERKEKVQIVNEGLDLFEEIFGFSSKSFIANSYTWDSLVEKTLAVRGVSLIQGISKQRTPLLRADTTINKHSYRFPVHYTGQTNQYGQHYLVRNAFFEPSQYDSSDPVGECLRRIEIAFQWKKPAIIGTHRINFVGGIDIKKRDSNIFLFRELLKSIVKKWPDVEFVSSDSLKFK